MKYDKRQWPYNIQDHWKGQPSDQTHLKLKNKTKQLRWDLSSLLWVCSLHKLFDWINLGQSKILHEHLKIFRALPFSIILK